MELNIMRVVSPTPSSPNEIANRARFVHVGAAGLDPQTNPVALYYDDKHTKRCPNPFPLLIGFNAFRGAQSQVFASGDVSIAITDANDNVLYTLLDASIIDVTALVAALLSQVSARYLLSIGATNVPAEGTVQHLAVGDAIGPDDMYSRVQLDALIDEFDSATFVVNSDATLSAFLTNAPGNDYTSVYFPLLDTFNFIATGQVAFPSTCLIVRSFGRDLYRGSLNIIVSAVGTSGFGPVLIANDQFGVPTRVENLQIQVTTPAAVSVVNTNTAIQAKYACMSDCTVVFNTLSIASNVAAINPVLTALIADVTFNVNVDKLTIGSACKTNATTLRSYGIVGLQTVNPKLNVTPIRLTPPLGPSDQAAFYAVGLAFVKVDKALETFNASILSTSFFVVADIGGDSVSDGSTPICSLLSTSYYALFLSGRVSALGSRSPMKLIVKGGPLAGSVTSATTSERTLRVSNVAKVGAVGGAIAVDASRQVDGCTVDNALAAVGVSSVSVGVGTMSHVASDNNGTFVHWTEGGLYYSKNYGATWTATPINGGANFNLMPTFSNGLWYTRLSTNSVISFPDPAVNEEIVTYGTLAGGALGSYAQFFRTHKNVLIAVLAGTYYKWTGVAWTAYTFPGALNNGRLNIIGGGELLIIISSTTYAVIMADGSVRTASAGFISTIMDAFFTDKRIFFLTPTDIKVQYDWISAPTPLYTLGTASFKSIVAADSVVLAVGTDSATNAIIVVRSADYGITWVNVSGAPPAVSTGWEIDFDGANNAIVWGKTAAAIVVGVSTDAGATWTWTTIALAPGANTGVFSIASIRGQAWVLAGNGANIIRRVIPGYVNAYRSSDTSAPAAATDAGGWNT